MRDERPLADLCRGRWTEILTHLGIDPKLLNKRHHACPFCTIGDEKSDRFRYTDHNGKGYVVCNQCMERPVDGMDFAIQYLQLPFAQVAKQIRGYLGVNPQATRQRSTEEQDLEKSMKMMSGLKTIWRGTRKIERGDPVDRYLEGRGLEQLYTGDAIRYHSSLGYFEKDDGGLIQKLGEHPGMVSRYLTPNGLTSTLHITYLTKQGDKADVPSPRKVRTPARPMDGGAVRLYPQRENGVVAIGEGIETMLAVGEMYSSFTPWAALNATMLERFKPVNSDVSDGMTAVMGDNDANFTGQKSAFTLGHTLKRQKHGVLQVYIPERVDSDWLDYYNNEFKAKRGQL